MLIPKGRRRAPCSEGKTDTKERRIRGGRGNRSTEEEKRERPNQ